MLFNEIFVMNFSSSLYIEFLLRADKILFIPFNLLKNPVWSFKSKYSVEHFVILVSRIV